MESANSSRGNGFICGLEIIFFIRLEKIRCINVN